MLIGEYTKATQLAVSAVAAGHGAKIECGPKTVGKPNPFPYFFSITITKG